MTKDEFAVIVKRLKSNYRSTSFIADDDAFQTWIAFFGHYTYRIVMKAANDYIQDRNTAPTIADLNEFVKRAIKDENVRSGAGQYGKKIPDCDICHGDGMYLIWKDEYGNEIVKPEFPTDMKVYEYMRVCKCQAGREKYPSLWQERWGSNDR